MDDSNIPAGFSSRGGEYGQQLAAVISEHGHHVRC
jgi:hypothetical protein